MGEGGKKKKRFKAKRIALLSGLSSLIYCLLHTADLCFCFSSFHLLFSVQICNFKLSLLIFCQTGDKILIVTQLIKTHDTQYSVNSV